MNTNSLTISVPESLKAFVESQVAEGGYPSAGDYIQALIQEAQARKAAHARRLEELRQEIALGLEEIERGDYKEYDDNSLKDLVAEIRVEGQRKLEERRRSQPS